MNSNTSIELLSRPQEGSGSARRIPAWLLPVGIAVGFALLFLALFGDRLLPADKVKVSPALIAPSTDESPATSPNSKNKEESAPVADANPLFQASGWIEPSPLPIKATALIDGVVEVVHVLPGQSVRKGDLLATLIQDDTRLTLETAKQRHRASISTLATHHAAIVAARKRAGGLEAQAAAASTLKEEASDRLRRLDRLSAEAIAESDVVTARLRLNREESQFLAATSAAEEMEAEIERLEAESKVREDDIAAATLEIEKAQLAFDRTKILAPADGRILRLLAAPGQKKMLQDQDPESSTIAILYQPGQLQVRVDVPLADASGIQIGQPVRIRCSLLPEKVFNGKVTLISGEADLQRNTLQTKVSIDDPVDQLRPEMLCRVEFLEVKQSDSGASTVSSESSSSQAIWVPDTALGGDSVWVCDPESKRVSKRTVQPSKDAKDGYVRVTGDVKPGEWVIISPSNLRDSQRVNPTLIEQ